MAFTYDLSTTIGKVRLEIGDTDPGAGVKPTGDNLDDAEIQYCIDNEGSDPGLVKRSAAAVCEILARHWATAANVSLGPRREDLGTVADQWATRAADLRAAYGHAEAGGVRSTVVTAGRSDGYSARAAVGSE